jgi:hypothetical protein
MAVKMKNFMSPEIMIKSFHVALQHGMTAKRVYTNIRHLTLHGPSELMCTVLQHRAG